MIKQNKTRSDKKVKHDPYMGYGIKRKQDDFKQYDLKTDKITEVVQKKKTYGSSSDSED